MSHVRPPRRVAGARRAAPSRESDGTSGERPCADVNADEIAAGPEDDVTVLLTAEQAAQRLQLRVSWLRRKAAARVIPCRYVGKHLRFTHDDLLAIADQFEAGPKVSGTTRRRIP